MSYPQPYVYQNAVLGLAFEALLFAAGVASTQTFGQLFNPIGSGINVIVSSIIAYAPAASVTGVAVGPVNTLQSGTAYAGINKKPGGPASKINCVAGTVATNPLTFPPAFGFLVSGTPANYNVLSEASPFVLTPGTGLIAICANANTTYGTTFQWMEVPQ